MNIEELKAKVAEYLATLDNVDQNEFYQTPFEFADGELHAFLEWLELQINPPHDIHRKAAADFLGIPYEEVTEEQRKNMVKSMTMYQFGSKLK